ncbi:MAG: hypothetical protein AMXMBFR56_50750 [Polyangiaceae bacterium]
MREQVQHQVQQQVQQLVRSSRGRRPSPESHQGLGKIRSRSAKERRVRKTGRNPRRLFRLHGSDARRSGGSADARNLRPGAGCSAGGKSREACGQSAERDHTVEPPELVERVRAELDQALGQYGPRAKKRARG